MMLRHKDFKGGKDSQHEKKPKTQIIESYGQKFKITYDTANI